LKNPGTEENTIRQKEEARTIHDEPYISKEAYPSSEPKIKLRNPNLKGSYIKRMVSLTKSGCRMENAIVKVMML